MVRKDQSLRVVEESGECLQLVSGVNIEVGVGGTSREMDVASYIESGSGVGLPVLGPSGDGPGSLRVARAGDLAYYAEVDEFGEYLDSDIDSLFELEGVEGGVLKVDPIAWSCGERMDDYLDPMLLIAGCASEVMGSDEASVSFPRVTTAPDLAQGCVRGADQESRLRESELKKAAKIKARVDKEIKRLSSGINYGRMVDGCRSIGQSSRVSVLDLC